MQQFHVTESTRGITVAIGVTIDANHPEVSAIDIGPAADIDNPRANIGAVLRSTAREGATELARSLCEDLHAIAADRAHWRDAERHASELEAAQTRERAESDAIEARAKNATLADTILDLRAQLDRLTAQNQRPARGAGTSTKKKRPSKRSQTTVKGRA